MPTQLETKFKINSINMETSEKLKNYAEKIITLITEKEEIDISKFDVEEIKKGIVFEISQNIKKETKKPSVLLNIVIENISEVPDYYTKLKKLQNERESVGMEKKMLLGEEASRRFKELCGISENFEKKPIKSMEKGLLLKEELDKDNFDIIKFKNDGLGEKESDEEERLYKMLNKK